MKRYFSFLIFICFLLTGIFFGFFETTNANTLNNAGYFRDLGGRITNTVANEILSFQMSGYICTVPGQSISIIPIGSPLATPLSFIIPFGVSSATGNPIRVGQYILAKYGGMATAYCVLPSVYPIPVTIPLPTIIYFGNSR